MRLLKAPIHGLFLGDRIIRFMIRDHDPASLFMNAPLSLYFLSFSPHVAAAYPREMRKMVVASGQGEAASRRTFQRLQAA